jgi:hypothetical protein
VDDATLLDRHLSRIELSEKQVVIFAHPDPQQPNSMSASQIKLPWSPNSQASFSSLESDAVERSDLPDPKAVQAIVRAHRWATALADQEYASVEELAASTKLHPKVVRSELRLAFLSPDIIEAILNGVGGLALRNLRKVGALNWRAQQAELYEGCRRTP